MAFEDFINPVGTNELADLPMWKEMSIDFETGQPILKNNDFIFLEGAEGLKVWIWKALKTERFYYRAYSNDYGNQLHEEIGQIYNRTVKEQLLYNEIRDCLMVNPYIQSVGNFSTEIDVTGVNVKITFQCQTIYGNIESITEVR